MHNSLYSVAEGGFEWPKKDDVVLDGSVYFKGWFSAGNQIVSIAVFRSNELISTINPEVTRLDVKEYLGIDSAQNLGFEFLVQFDNISTYEICVIVGGEHFKVWEINFFKLPEINSANQNVVFLKTFFQRSFQFELFLKSYAINENEFWESFNDFKANFLIVDVEELTKIYGNELSDCNVQVLYELMQPDWSVNFIARISTDVNTGVKDIFSGESFFPTQSFVVDDKNYIAFTNGEDVFYIVQHSCNVCLFYPSKLLVIKLSIDPWVYEVVESIPRLFQAVVSCIRPEFLNRNSNFLGLNLSHSRPYHYFYDYVHGLARLTNICHKSFDTFSIKGFDFFNLDELSVVSNFSSFSEQNLNSYVAGNNGFLIMPTVQLVPSDEIIKVSNVPFESSNEKISLISELLSSSIIRFDEHAFPLNFDNYDFVFWVGIATEKRSWLEQVEGIVNIINKLKGRFNNILILIDGRTFPLHPSKIDYNAKIKDDDVFERIRAASDGVDFYSLIGKTPLEKLAFARKINLFFSSFATDSMYPSALSEKLGVVYVAPSIGEQRKLHVHHSIIEVPSDKVTEIKVDGKSWHETSVSMDWRDVYSCIEQVLDRGN